MGARAARTDVLVRVLFGVAGLLLLLLVALASFYFGREMGGDGGARPAASTAEGEFDFRVLNQIREILHREYVNPNNLDDETLYEAAINAMLGVLNDSGTYYLDPQTYQVSVLPGGFFDGVGLTISRQGQEIVVVAPISGTPAEAAGLKTGDVIVAVDGESTRGWTTERTVLRVRGPRGTQVTLTIRHPDGTVRDYTLTRAQIRVDSVTIEPPGGTLVDAAGNPANDIGYMRIREFTARTPEEVQEALRELRRRGVRGLILDMRGNPGGLMEAAAQVADMFLDRGIIVIQRDRDGRERAISARPGDLTNGMPIVVLQNRFSASASEIVAAALQENGRAITLGETSLGKGFVNVARELRDGGAVFVSVAYWLTPSGALIEGSGVRADIEHELTDEDFDLRRDSQAIRAVEVLRGRIGTR